MVRCARSKFGGGRDDVAAHGFDWLDVFNADEGSDYGLHADLGELTDLVEQLACVFAVGSRVRDVEDCLFDVVVVTAFTLAVGAQDIEFLLDETGPGHGEDVAGVGVLRDQTEGLLLAGAADEDAGMGLPDGLRDVEGLGEPVVLALEGTVIVAPHLVGDLESVFEAFEALLQRREIDTEAMVLAVEPGGADTEPGAATREDVESGRLFDEDAGVPVGDTGDHGAERGFLRLAGDEAEGCVGLEHVEVCRADGWDL